MIDESQLRKWLFPLYHGTDIRIVKMSKEERQSFKEDCIKVADYLWGIYKDSFDDITNGKYRAVLGETRWLNLYNALTVGKLNHEG